MPLGRIQFDLVLLGQLSSEDDSSVKFDEWGCESVWDLSLFPLMMILEFKMTETGRCL